MTDCDNRWLLLLSGPISVIKPDSQDESMGWGCVEVLRGLGVGWGGCGG